MASESSWRHLDTIQVKTTLKARVPRCDCLMCGVETISLPWAQINSWFTLMFEAFANRVLQACSNVKQAEDLLRLNWDTVLEILKRAVERGLERLEIKVGMRSAPFRFDFGSMR